VLKRGDQVPDFNVTRTDGTRITYTAIWQRKNLLLLALPPYESDATAVYLEQLADRIPELTANGTELVITKGLVPGVEPPAVIVADRWGEIYFAAAEVSPAALPSATELIEWLRYVQQQCPECEGESR